MKNKTNTKSDYNKRTVEPIKNIEDIERIRSILVGKPRDLLLFDLATQTGIGMKKLLSLKVRDFTGKKEGEKIFIGIHRDNKNTIIITDVVYKSLKKYLDEDRLKPDDYLFKSKKGQRPINLSTVSNMINDWFREAEIENCFGAKSLRKTYQFNHKDKTNIDQENTFKKADINNKKINMNQDNDIFEPKSILKPLKATTAQDQIYDELLRAIVTRRIPPGSRITVSQISEAFQISHTPVRAAMNWLEARGFLIRRNNKASIIRELTHKEFFEVIQLRIAIESQAAKLSYKVCTDETLYLLESIIERFKKVEDFDESEHLNRLFHQTLYRDANLPLHTRLIVDLFDRFSPYASLAFEKRKISPDLDYIQDPPEYYHLKILDAMRRKNIKELIKYLEMKLRRGQKMTKEAIDEINNIAPIE